MQARFESRRGIRRGWRTDERGRNRTSGPFDVYARVVTFYKTEAAHVLGEAKQRGLNHPKRVDDDWEGKTGYRQVLLVE